MVLSHHHHLLPRHKPVRFQGIEIHARGRHAALGILPIPLGWAPTVRRDGGKRWERLRGRFWWRRRGWRGPLWFEDQILYFSNGSCQASFVPVHADFSFLPETGMSQFIFTSNATINRPNSGWTRCACVQAAEWAGAKFGVCLIWSKETKNF